MIVRYGRSIEKGFLPAHRVCCEARAQKLLVLSCGTTVTGEFFARELVQEQTIPNLRAFGERLKQSEELLGACEDCKED